MYGAQMDEWPVMWSRLFLTIAQQLGTKELECLRKYFDTEGANSISEFFSSLNGSSVFTAYHRPTREHNLISFLDALETSEKKDLHQLTPIRQYVRYCPVPLKDEIEIQKDWMNLVALLKQSIYYSRAEDLCRAFYLHNVLTVQEFFTQMEPVFLGKEGLKKKEILMEVDIGNSVLSEELFHHIRLHRRLEYHPQPKASNEEEMERLRLRLVQSETEIINQASMIKDLLAQIGNFIKPMAPVSAPAKKVIAAASEDQKAECSICLEKQKTYAGKECGHLCVCQGCSAGLKTCPLCRKETTFIQIFD